MAQGHVYGIASVTQALQGIDFPKSKSDLINQYGGKQVEFHRGHKMTLKDVLQKSSERDFKSMADVVHAVHDAYSK